MAKHATMQIRIDEDLKEQADRLFEALGLSPSEAVRLFVAQSVIERRLPFTPHLSKSEGGTSAFGKLRQSGESWKKRLEETSAKFDAARAELRKKEENAFGRRE